MILGMSTATFTLVHVILSLVGIATGLIVVIAMIQNRRLDGVALVFLATTILTSATGFLFPNSKVTPGQIVGGISLVLLTAAVVSIFRHLRGPWRWIYIVSSVGALYFNVFVLIAQGFQKVAFLKALAPTGSEPPFAVAQLVNLVLFGVLGYLAVKRFRPARKTA